jgi:NAD(P)-dependent dehydrogenase (short-subunit alcohol dehydrogenase family)
MTGAIAVTGANRGIGAAIAAELLHRGFAVGCLSRSGAGPSGLGLAPSAQARMIACACDVTDEASVKQALASVVRTAGSLRGLVNNAGIHREGKSSELPTAEFEQMMTTNATSAFVVAREAYPHLVAAGGGTIVNIGSFFDKLGVKRNLAYCASKAAVGAITRCLAVEWAGKNIRCIDVAPGYIETDLNRAALAEGPLKDYLEKRIPAGRAGSPAAVAKMVAAIFSEDITFLTGATIYLDGGQGIAH